MSATEVIVIADGTPFYGWEKAAVSLSIDELSRAFSLDLFDPDERFANVFTAGAGVDVIATNGDASEVVVSGFVSGVKRTLQASGDALSFEGYDRLKDLVDCSALNQKRSWTRAKFTAIVRDLLDPFGVRLDTSQLARDSVIERFTLQSGETVFAAIERLCRSQAVLPVSDGVRTLVLTYTKTGSERATEALVAGKNVVSLSAEADWTERFSEYVGLTQEAGRGKAWSDQLLQRKEVAQDVGVTRYRPLLFVAESRADGQKLRDRVRWEAQVRSGRAQRFGVVVDGWFQRDAQGRATQLWKPNQLVELRCDRWGLRRELVVSSVDLELSASSGETAKLQLVNPSVFAPNPAEKVDLS